MTSWTIWSKTPTLIVDFGFNNDIDWLKAKLKRIWTSTRLASLKTIKINDTGNDTGNDPYSESDTDSIEMSDLESDSNGDLNDDIETTSI